MSMNDTPSGERIHIGFFGRRNAGKSSLVNAVTDQELAVVSEQKGTTTDPVMKSMELLPLGPVLIIDTPGFDDEGMLGEKRMQKTRQVLNRTDIAILVVDAIEGLQPCDEELVDLFQKKQIPYLIVYNKSDIVHADFPLHEHEMFVSAKEKTNIHELKERIASLAKREAEEKVLVSDLVKPGSVVVLVIPIDASAPKGRIILPQQQVIRDLLEHGCMAACVRDTELPQFLEKMKPAKPDLVITDSQAFKRVAADVPADIPLTSFSILMARYKGFLDTAIAGVAAIEKLEDGSRILISEGCTHHRQCEDIGTVKIPKWLRAHTGKEIEIETTSGREFPEDLAGYDLVIHCGACMLNEKEVQYRMKTAIDQGVPFTNYGITIAQTNGILKRSVEILGKADELV